MNMLILMSDTGGGHRASAQALEAALEEMFPGRIAVTMVDIFTEHSRWPYSASVPAYQVGEGLYCVEGGGAVRGVSTLAGNVQALPTAVGCCTYCSKG